MMMAAVAAEQAEAQADATDLDEHHLIEVIVVTATPLSRTVENLAQPSAVLAGDALVRAQTSSIGETLADVLGVSSSYFGPIASRPVIRGQYGERVEVLSNGLSALDASALSEDHAVSLDSILADRVEVVRGPLTLLYGSGAAGGIVNIADSRIHEQPLDKLFSGAVSLGTDSAIGKKTGAFKLDAGTENVIFHVDYMDRSTDDIEIPGFAESQALRDAEEAEEPGGEEEEEAFGTVENTDSDTEAAGAALTLLGEAGFLGLSVSTYETNYGLPGAHAHEEEEPLPGEAEEEEIIRIDLEQTRYDLHGELETSGFIESTRLKFAVNDYQHVELEGPEVGTLYDNQGIDSRLELKHRAIGKLEGAFGLQYKQIDFDAVGEEAFVPASETTQLGLFLWEEWAVADTLTLQGSARIERQEITSPGLPDYDDTAGGVAIGAIWSLGERYTLSGNLSATERHPNSTELYADGPHLAVQRFERGSVTQGNGILKNEFSQNLDLTLRADFSPVELAITGFINNIDDYIALLPTEEVEDGLQVFNYAQADAELYGFEAEGLVDFFENENSHAHVRLFADYTRGKLRNGGGDLPRIPPLRYGLSVHYRVGSFDASLSATRVEEQDNVAENELPTAAYTMVDAEVSWHAANPDLLLFLRGTNLGDEDARRHTSPLKDVLPLPGRSLVTGLRWNF
jgi:iron complex outermembrane receptor protein